jgi:hypothetical protein
VELAMPQLGRTVRVIVAPHRPHSQIWVSAPASLGRALGMIRANSIGTLQVGQNGASNWRSFDGIMGGVLSPSMWDESPRISTAISRTGVPR